MAYIQSANIPRTNIRDRELEPGPPVTVQFKRWTAFLDTAYQKNQFAGFSEEHAQQLVKMGAARIVARQ